MESLKGQVRLHANALLNTESTRHAITAHASQSSLRDRLEKQRAYNQQCLYRICAGITTFRVQDPDPNAVDGGRVLGIKIEVMTRAKFLRPYYVLLNRPFSGSESGQRFLRVHRHTVPPCIAFNGLAARHLPAPKPTTDSGNDDGQDIGLQRKQDLSRFVRSVRREIVRYHNRIAIIADLRRALGLDGKRDDAEDPDQSSIFSISAADTEAKHVRIDWRDGRSGRLVIGDDGDVLKLVVFGERGRECELTRELLSHGSRLEHIARTLAGV